MKCRSCPNETRVYSTDRVRDGYQTTRYRCPHCGARQEAVARIDHGEEDTIATYLRDRYPGGMRELFDLQDGFVSPVVELLRRGIDNATAAALAEIERVERRLPDPWDKVKVDHAWSTVDWRTGVWVYIGASGPYQFEVVRNWDRLMEGNWVGRMTGFSLDSVYVDTRDEAAQWCVDTIRLLAEDA